MNKKMLIIIAAVVLLLVVIGGVVFVFVINKPETEPEIVYLEYRLDEGYSNLADVDSNKIIKYQVTIEYTNADTLALLDKNKTKIVNNIDEIMRITSSEDIDKPNGKQRIRDRIKEMVIEVLDSDEETITDVYIQPFIVQG
ncbi:flagellar basal body-associated FliL family protein [Fusibacter ferrireducens]|uniref:Flagellar protein FliL n=1 Tax=Fusibacter ferrireducens TaxID=2785058 RepID=A0ABR9ZMP5_9FIRM|nr:flagellar basal body-associated FliL family protein [Fusibacter ferrireducens]MBF4691735.1 flagellar basal body-associated FliL family protein [Fusibacter ferrireducens]